MADEKTLDLIEEAVRGLGASGNYAGFPCMVRAVELVLEDPSLLHAVSKLLYPQVAEGCGSSAINVERNLRTLVGACWDRGDRQLLDRMAGYHVASRPTTGEVIDWVAHHVSRLSRCR